mgnify:CR=1 FL=1
MKYVFFNSPVHGIGCKAVEFIKKGDIVAEEPYFIFSNNIQRCAHPIFGNYYWLIKGKCLIINGLGNYCNHSDNNNIEPIHDLDKPFICFKALKDIQIGDELFNNYGTKYWESRKNKKNKVSFFRF